MAVLASVLVISITHFSPTDCCTIQNGLDALIAELPTRNLPRGLIPKRGLHLQPPRFHYGWTFSLQELFETATRCGFAVLKNRPLPPGSKSNLKNFAGFATRLEFAKTVREKLEISTCVPNFVYVYSKKLFCISLTNNYRRGNTPPPAADVGAIQRFLGMDEPPAWFLDVETGRQWDVGMF